MQVLTRPRSPTRATETADPTDWRPALRMRLQSPVKPNAPKRARIVVARAYVDWLGLTIDDLSDR
jgi:hypothetical protein